MEHFSKQQRAVTEELRIIISWFYSHCKILLVKCSFFPLPFSQFGAFVNENRRDFVPLKRYMGLFLRYYEGFLYQTGFHRDNKEKYTS